MAYEIIPGPDQLCQHGHAMWERAHRALLDLRVHLKQSDDLTQGCLSYRDSRCMTVNKAKIRNLPAWLGY